MQGTVRFSRPSLGRAILRLLPGQPLSIAVPGVVCPRNFAPSFLMATSTSTPPILAMRQRAARDRSQPAGLRVALLPFYHDNPYQQRLVEQLRALGVEVATRIQLKGLFTETRKRENRPDVVHLHWLPGYNGKPVTLARLLMYYVRVRLLRHWGIRIVWTVHNLYPHEGRHRGVDRRFIRGIIQCASQLIVHSPSAADMVRQEFGVRDWRKIAVVPHGHYIDSYPNTISRAEARRKLGLPAHGTVLLFLGKIRRYKGVSSLVRTFQEVAPSDATLVVAGAPVDDQIVGEIRQLVHQANVMLYPEFVPDDTIQVYMNAADAVVFPYQDVLTSGAVILAMSFGKACIAPRLGCIGDVLDERGSVLYNPDAPEGLKNALSTALAQPERLAAMGHHNLTQAQRWRWDDIARATVEVYDGQANRVMQGSPATSPLELPSGS